MGAELSATKSTNLPAPQQASSIVTNLPPVSSPPQPQGTATDSNLPALGLTYKIEGNISSAVGKAEVLSAQGFRAGDPASIKLTKAQEQTEFVSQYSSGRDSLPLDMVFLKNGSQVKVLGFSADTNMAQVAWPIDGKMQSGWVKSEILSPDTTGSRDTFNQVNKALSSVPPVNLFALNVN
jgi:hypothetical protein